MPNLMLTTRCNFDCPYCFGRDLMGAVRPGIDMTRDTFLALMEWLGRVPFAGYAVHLMGGEPTLHDDFVWMVQTAKARGMDLLIFSNAATRNAPDFAAQLTEATIRWVVNVNPPDERTDAEDANLRESLRIIGDKGTLTFNMRPDPVPHGWVLDLICEYSLKKTVKVGFVLPTLSHTNEHLADEDYPRVAERVMQFARLCEAFEVSLEYECGVPWCAFSPAQMGELWHLNSRFFSSCDSILDITPDGRVIYCLPLATMHQVPFQRFDNYPAAKAWFESTLGPYRALGTTPRCSSCILMRSGPCRGSCLARVLAGAHNVHEGVTDEQPGTQVGG